TLCNTFLEVLHAAPSTKAPRKRPAGHRPYQNLFLLSSQTPRQSVSHPGRKEYPWPSSKMKETASVTAGTERHETPEQTVARVAAAGRRVETPTGGGQMVWHVWGEGEPLVLLHGSFGSWTHWIRNIETLASRYRVIAGDIPGMGDSDQPALPFTIDSLAAEVSAGLDILLPKPARFHFAGFSFGGIVGGHVCVLQKDRVQTYTALGSNALGLPMGDRNHLAKASSRMTEAELMEVHRKNLGFMMIADPANIDELALYIQNT